MGGKEMGRRMKTKEGRGGRGEETQTIFLDCTSVHFFTILCRLCAFVTWARSDEGDRRGKGKYKEGKCGKELRREKRRRQKKEGKKNAN